MQNSFSRHSGIGQNQVKTIVYWMLVFTSMTIKILNQSFLNHVHRRSCASMHTRHCLHGCRYLGFVRNKNPDITSCTSSLLCSRYGLLSSAIAPALLYYRTSLYISRDTNTSCMSSMQPRHTTATDGGNVGIAGAFSDRTSCT